jgi:RNA-directed DNA polymerase
MKHPWNSQLFATEAHAGGVSSATVEAVRLAASAIKRVNPDLPVILTLGHLAHLVDVSQNDLLSVINRRADSYRVFAIKKRGRPGWEAAPRRPSRTICVPIPWLMRTQRWIAQNILNVMPTHPASYAFAPQKNLVQAASRHCGCSWLVKMDVRNFFESIRERQVFKVFRSAGYSDLLAFEMARLCTRLRLPDAAGSAGFLADPRLPHPRQPDGFLPQGAPSSPMLANLAVRKLDIGLQALAGDSDWTYTRYADDLAFSCHGSCDRRQAAIFVRAVKLELRRFGLNCNHSKTTITPPGARKILLGLLVDREVPKLTRSFRNNIETHLFALECPRIGAVAHQNRRGFSSAIGMMRHLCGLVAFAHMVDALYASELYRRLNAVNWER